MNLLQPIEIENEMIEAYALLTYVSEQTENDIAEDWNQGLQKIILMLEGVLQVHRNTAMQSVFNPLAGASATLPARTRNERRVASKLAKKRRKGS